MTETERIVEHKESAPSVTILDLQEFYGMSLEEIGRHAVDHFVEEVTSHPRREAHFRRKYDLPPELPIADALRQKSELVVAEYQLSYPETRKRFLEQAKRCAEVAKDKGYIAEIPGYSVLVTHDFFSPYLMDSAGSPSPNQYDISSNTIVLLSKESNRQFAHEVGHVFSTSTDKTHSGFQELESSEDQKIRAKNNRWFNEGATLLWEDISVHDGSEIEKYTEESASYPVYKKTAQLIANEINMSDDEVLRAYFGDNEASEKLHRGIQDRFGCSLEDLDCLMVLQLDFAYVKKILLGNPVEIVLKTERSKGVIKDSLKLDAEKLSRIFPNVTVVMN